MTWSALPLIKREVLEFRESPISENKGQLTKLTGGVGKSLTQQQRERKQKLTKVEGKIIKINSKNNNKNTKHKTNKKNDSYTYLYRAIRRSIWSLVIGIWSMVFDNW